MENTTYAIFEGNMERLEKKLARISNKCAKYGCEFKFNEVGEEFREVKDEAGQVQTLRFVIVEAEGVAKLNDWRFIASVEHTDKGNIINRAAYDIEVPERFYTSNTVCEHCGTNRARKDTYIVLNEVTGEFKQVGKSCLADFTNGLSASAIAQYYSWFDEIIKGEEVTWGGSYARYYPIDELLPFYAETVRKFGYVKTVGDGYSTRSRGFDLYALLVMGQSFGRDTEVDLRKDIEKVQFDATSQEVLADVEAALTWLSKQEATNNYIHNLQTIIAMEYVGWKHLGILASLFPTWKRETVKAEERKELAAKNEVQKQLSKHIGDVGQRFTFKVESFEMITSWETAYGMTFMYKMIDEAGNVLIWKSSKWIDEPEKIKTVTGTVKAHTEFNMVQQTEVTRCKVS